MVFYFSQGQTGLPTLHLPAILLDYFSIARATTHSVLGHELKVASIEAVLRGKVGHIQTRNGARASDKRIWLTLFV
jgi:hypothetical protein